MLSEEQLEKMDLDKEIKDRQDLINQMVGWLYPSILAEEINQLLKKKEELGQN